MEGILQGPTNSMNKPTFKSFCTLERVRLTIRSLLEGSSWWSWGWCRRWICCRSRWLRCSLRTSLWRWVALKEPEGFYMDLSYMWFGPRSRCCGAFKEKVKKMHVFIDCPDYHTTETYIKRTTVHSRTVRLRSHYQHEVIQIWIFTIWFFLVLHKMFFKLDPSNFCTCAVLRLYGQIGIHSSGSNSWYN